MTTHVEKDERSSALNLIGRLPGAVVLLSADELRVKYFSDAYRTYLPEALKNEDLIGVRFVDYVADGENNRSVASARRISGSGKGTEIKNYHIKNRDGVEFWVDWIGSPVDNGTEKWDVLLQIRDITEGKKMEEALKNSESMYRGLFENLHENVVLRRFVYDENGKIVDRVLIDANPAALKPLGVGSIEEVRGKTDSDVYRSKMSTDLLEVARRLKNTGGPITEEVHFYDSDEDYLTTYSLLGEDQMITMSIDITERKRAEKALQRSKDELEQKVLELYKGTERERSGLQGPRGQHH